MYTAKAIEKFDTAGKGYLTYDEFQGLIASFKLKFTPVQMSEVDQCISVVVQYAILLYIIAI